MTDVDLLVQEKYGGNRNAEGVAEDLTRLEAGEPLAYVIGHIPFLGISIDLSSHPLIPRPETEWWTELLIQRIGTEPLRILDLCAGSGAVGLAVLKHCPNAFVSFGEVVESHAAMIRTQTNSSRSDVRTGDLFAPFEGQQFDIVATNPPYIPDGRELEASLAYEPKEALYSGTDGLDHIRRIAAEANQYTNELWLECDIGNIEDALSLILRGGATEATIRTDQYDRPRIVVAYY